MTTRIVLLALLAALLAACGAAPKAWQRGVLASPEMAFEADPLLAGYRDHAFMSKEQASGGANAGGGGCGCSN